MIIIHILKADGFWSMGMVLDFKTSGCGGHRNFVSVWHNLGHSFIDLVIAASLYIFCGIQDVVDLDTLFPKCCDNGFIPPERKILSD